MISMVYVTGLLIMVAFCFSFVRLLLGPTLADRVVALDLMASIAVSGICLYAMVTEQYIFIDAAMVLALILFLSTIAFAYYMEKKGEAT